MEADEVTSLSTATGNSFDSTVQNGDQNVRSYQEAQGAVGAVGATTVHGYSGVTVTTAAATGNTGDATIIGGTMTATATQLTGAGPVTSESWLSANAATTGDISAASQATANSQGFGVSYGAAGVRATQHNEAETVAAGGGTVGYITGQATFASTATGNNVSLGSAGGSSVAAMASQYNGAARIEANQLTWFGNAYVTSANATAVGNNVSAGNEGPVLQVQSDQNNAAQIAAYSVSRSTDFGAGTAAAYGVGNSLLAGNAGQELTIDASQLNDGGGVEAVATYEGEAGYDATASATAMGNAATGYVCSECSGRMSVANNQTNNTSVTSSSRVTVSGSGRSISGVSTAVGNSASYYVTQPQ